ncbi:hypothetical protein [Streptomyces sp. NPDC059850]|uniref:hypothetical protein n=1 Tax=Streptomyces sp. NPDC059850 TaxID=3346970 RepID=UPI00365DE6BF
MTGPARREQPSAPASAHEQGPKGRRGSVDPVRALMHRHRELCARAVDPLEIAAGLEAHGVTDRTAARFRHRDVFSLAEELYARVPRDGDGDSGDDAPCEPPSRPWAVRAALGLLALLPGGLAVATVIGAYRTGTPVVGATGAALTAGALWLCLRRGPLAVGGRGGRGGTGGLGSTGGPSGSTGGRGGPGGTGRRGERGSGTSGRGGRGRRDGGDGSGGRGGKARSTGRSAGRLAGLPGALRTGWLLAYAACGDWLLGGLSGRTAGTGAPGPYDPAAAAGAAVVLGLAVAPAAWCARWFAVRARRRLAASSGLDEFAAGVRPLCAATAVAFLLTLPPLVIAARLAVPGAAADLTAEAGVAALAGLLFLARLLTVHGFRAAAATGTAVACAAEAAVLGAAGAARLPGCAALGEPVRRLAAAHGTAAVPAVACGAAALALLVYACAALSRASAHNTPTTPPTPSPPPIPTRSTSMSDETTAPHAIPGEARR